MEALSKLYQIFILLYQFFVYLREQKLEESLRFDIISVATVTECRCFIVCCYRERVRWEARLLAGCFILSKQTRALIHLFLLSRSNFIARNLFNLLLKSTVYI